MSSFLLVYLFLHESYMKQFEILWILAMGQIHLHVHNNALYWKNDMPKNNAQLRWMKKKLHANKNAKQEKKFRK
mgnify:CR=1 FL=1